MIMARRNIFFAALVTLSASVLGSHTSNRGVDSPRRPIGFSSSTSFVLRIPSGGSTEDAVAQFDVLKSKVFSSASEKIEALRKEIVDNKSVISEFGEKSSTILNDSLEEFASGATIPEDDPVAAAAYDLKLEEVEMGVDSPLHVLYLRQLALLRENALQNYKTSAKAKTGSEYEAMMSADAKFAREAEKATRMGSPWEYATERSFLRRIMTDIADSGQKAMDIQVKGAQQQQTAMQFLQSQQQMIQQLQQQLYGQTSPWNVGVAYRIPDTNFNLQGSYQQGRGSLQVSCVPDEYAPFLGPNGFTNGVGPGNLGLSLNLSV